MGSALSQEETKAIQPQLHGFEPASLASVIWDSINDVGVDDEREKMGIDFSTNDEEGQAGVVFWDQSGVTQLPKKVFLQVLEFVARQTIDSYESNYDLDKSPALAAAVHRLQLAFTHLRRKIESMKGDEDACVYRERLNSGASVEQSESESIVEELRTRRGSWHWANGEPDDFARLHERRRSSKGFVGVVERLPELRRRYEQSVAGKSRPLDRVRNKLRALTIFQRGVVTPSSIPEESDSAQETVNSPTAKNYSLLQDSTPPASSFKRRPPLIPGQSLPFMSSIAPYSRPASP